MYYDQNPNIVETDDLVGITKMLLEKAEGELAKLHVTFHIHPQKILGDIITALHLTNGVDHRLLSPLPDDVAVTVDVPESPQSTATVSSLPLASTPATEPASPADLPVSQDTQSSSDDTAKQEVLKSGKQTKSDTGGGA